jgi:hypothetical protein
MVEDREYGQKTKCIVFVHVMKKDEGVEAYLHSFLTLPLDCGE